MSRAIRWRLLLAALLVMAVGLLSAAPARAANPTTMSFQGKVVNSNGTNVTDGTYGFVFKLYTASSGGTAIWTETDSLSVAAGVFQVNLGAVCPFFTANACNGSTPIDFNADPNLYLGITFNSDPAGEMTPRVQLQSVPFAYNADKVGGLSASQLVQLSPGSQQSGAIDVSGTATAAGGVITPSLTAAGALAINSGGATNVTLDSGSTGTAAIAIGGTNATSVALSRTGQTTTVNGALAVNQGTTLNSNVVMTFSGTENLAVTSDLSGTVNGISFIGTPSATTGTTNGMFIQQAASTNTNGLDDGLTIDNADNNTVIGAALNITNTGGAGYTNYISSPNFTVAGTGQIYGKGFDYFDPSTLTTTSALMGSGGAAGGNFGGAFDSGAFIGDDDTYDQEFVGSIAAATTNNANAGDDGLWYFNNNGQASITGADVSATGGSYEFAAPATTNRGALLTQGATPGTQDKPIVAANLPIIQMKAKISATRATDDLVFGAMDTATATVTNDTLPQNGFVFWTDNSTGTTGWQGVVRSGGATVGTPVTCPTTADVTAGAYAVGRIVVVNATTVHFYIDSSASSGVNLIDCGTVTGTLPTVGLAMGMYLIQTVATATTADLDYARFWQDDAAPAVSSDATTTAAEQAEADVSTGSEGSGDTVDASTVTGDNTGGTTSGVVVDTPGQADPPLQADTTDTSAPPNQATTSSSTQIKLTSSNSSFQLIGNDGQQMALVDTGGNATYSGSLNAVDANLSGGLTVTGNAAFNGLSTFQKLATFIGGALFHGDVTFDGHLTVANDTAGYASLRAGESMVHVTFAKPYAKPPVVSASIINGQFAASSVNDITEQGFDIDVQNPATAPVTFGWTAVGVTDPRTATDPLPSSTSQSSTSAVTN